MIFLAVGRFFYAPMAVWVVQEWVSAVVFPDRERRRRSVKVVDGFCETVVKSENGKSEGSFQARLMTQGTSAFGTAIECKDAILAGEYFVGVVVAEILWLPARNPDKFGKLRKELLEAKANGDEINAQSLSYL